MIEINLTKHTGKLIPRIMDSYNKECFRFSDNYLRMIFPAADEVYRETPQVSPQVTPQVTPQVRDLLNVFKGEESRTELQKSLGLVDRKNFRINYLNPALEEGFVELTIPDKPKSSKQKYRLTKKGRKAKQE